MFEKSPIPKNTVHKTDEQRTDCTNAYDLIADEQKMLDFVKPFLEDEGYEVWTVRKGKDAVRIVQELKPNTVYGKKDKRCS
ncbi:hypothetical protein NQ117_02360 [Paenibacillus sp. SC116]|uniref:hypothetical protein n=1 Tax=Paenibacillus sp. SC116 TaxID=2968986 RepID=UPI00215B74CA|nr:hypothetical protein [Paenibacillus sp. SC116]MCR8842515.1 hypothetical protein [Paenibacillus sp. SC116]